MSKNSQFSKADKLWNKKEQLFSKGNLLNIAAWDCIRKSFKPISQTQRFELEKEAGRLFAEKDECYAEGKKCRAQADAILNNLKEK